MSCHSSIARQENNCRTGNPPLRHKISLRGVSETMLIPVWARATETLRNDGLIQDTHALRLMQEIDYDFSKFSGGWRTQTGVAVRTRLLDRAVARFLKAHPEGSVISLGCGLDARSYRMDNTLAQWFDLDLPEAIAFRKLFFDESPRHTMLESSVTDHGWMDAVPRSGPVMFIAEGLLMYLPPHEVRRLFEVMARRFPGGIILFEALSHRFVGKDARHDTVSRCSAPFLWGVDRAKELCAWSTALRFESETPYFDCPPNRWGWVRWLRWLPPVKKAVKICAFSFQA